MCRHKYAHMGGIRYLNPILPHTKFASQDLFQDIWFNAQPANPKITTDNAHKSKGNACIAFKEMF